MKVMQKGRSKVARFYVPKNPMLLYIAYQYLYKRTPLELKFIQTNTIRYHVNVLGTVFNHT